MEVIEIKLQKAVLIMMSIVSMSGVSSCEDRLDSPRPSTGGGKAVEVSLCVGLADEEDAVGGTKTITVPDDPLATARPDKLYGLEVWQYDRSGSFVAGKGASLGDVAIGSSFSVTLTAMDDCQLLIIARGYGSSNYTVGSLKDKSLSSVQGTTAPTSTIEGITTEGGVNAMPYILHLPYVNVTEDGRIESPEGSDIRILLRRLATRLTVAWENLPDNTGYDLRQVMLQSIPVEYKLLPDNKDSYPSPLDQYRTIQVSNVTNKGQYTCWAPAVLREESANATSDYYRTKANAPKGSAYATFISQHKTDNKKKLNYRVYLGGNSSKDFSLRDNTNYIYKVTMDHTSLPVDDKRITIIDPILASENNNNLVPTANCFMVVPGGAFCFNPYTYYVNGVSKDNTLLRGWCGLSGSTLSSPIKSVKVLWQTLEDGDLGDPVLGVVTKYAPQTTEDDHTNIVELKNGESLTDARIYCRVATNTVGGSGMIAAYDGDNGTGNILWSWHIWVTDYSPSATANESVDDENKRVQKYTYGNKTQYPMMDRNLGAMAGYTIAPSDKLERSKTNGFHYQWGRKDPFPSTYSSKSPTSIKVNSDKLTPGMLNLYQPDGVSYFIRKSVSASAAADSWCSESSDVLWNSSEGNKTEYDPCPAGWRVASKVNYQSFFTSQSYTESENIETMNLANSSLEGDGGAVFYFENQASGRSTYIRFTGYQQYANSFDFIGGMGNLWCREAKGGGDNGRHGYALSFILPNKVSYAMSGKRNISGAWATRDAHPLRCIQDR